MIKAFLFKTLLGKIIVGITATVIVSTSAVVTYNYIQDKQEPKQETQQQESQNNEQPQNQQEEIKVNALEELGLQPVYYYNDGEFETNLLLYEDYTFKTTSNWEYKGSGYETLSGTFELFEGDNLDTRNLFLNKSKETTKILKLTTSEKIRLVWVSKDTQNIEWAYFSFIK